MVILLRNAVIWLKGHSQSFIQKKLSLDSEHAVKQHLKATFLRSVLQTYYSQSFHIMNVGKKMFSEVKRPPPSYTAAFITNSCVLVIERNVFMRG